MKRVLILLAPGFEEIEAVTIIDILRRAAVEVTVAGTVEGAIEGSRKVRLLADLSIDKVAGGDYHMIVLPGGQPGTNHLAEDERVGRILKEAAAKERYISAICAAPSILAAAGFLNGKKATSHPSVRERMGGADYSEARVVVDGRWVTSRSPGTAMEFAFELVRLLAGEEKAKEVNLGVMARL
ncbi:DJ-1 family glyoxalase III [Candidatus Manganitrophus noduliformans]|uniref:DJ-1/PfpI family protein n=1 Tax=Candidatus Manganitrophus noduliformans TaxID=2606439 RepID=A0A7X6DQG7_9BACT|nr:DJ-1 family glyoxalase III [Candidatus Manganitrophus noduliformans]NKE71344.1 DJ-1/PfpI family protein [Candidatus Manganitrophus noduliformans]